MCHHCASITELSAEEREELLEEHSEEELRSELRNDDIQELDIEV